VRWGQAIGQKPGLICRFAKPLWGGFRANLRLAKVVPRECFELGENRMAYQATVLSIMIASPGDVLAERDAATNVIYRWNAIHARKSNTVLLPVRWETHSTSDLGGRAQQLINDRVLRYCDLLVGIFWTKLGTPTGKAESGTAEEIKEHLAAGKPAMVFFSRQPVVLESIDRDEYDRLQTFKKWCREQGITWDYEDPFDFERKFDHQLQLQINTNPQLNEILKSDPNIVLPAITASPPPAPDLSREAIELLGTAAKDRGQILVVDVIGGRIIQAGGKQFGSSDKRAIANYDFAIEELETNNLIRARGLERQVFQVTKLGYDLIEGLGL
jgi:hypothetical protein